MSSSIGKNIHAPLAGCGRIVTESLGPTQHCAGWQQGKWAKVLAGDTALHPVSLAEKRHGVAEKWLKVGRPCNLLKLCMSKWPKCPNCPRVIFGEYDAHSLVFGAYIIEGFVALFRWSAKIRCALSFVPRFQLFGVSMGWIYLTINKHGSEVYSKMRFSKLSWVLKTKLPTLGACSTCRCGLRTIGQSPTCFRLLLLLLVSLPELPQAVKRKLDWPNARSVI